MKRFVVVNCFVVLAVVFLFDFFFGQYFLDYPTRKFAKQVVEQAQLEKGYREAHPVFHHTLKPNVNREALWLSPPYKYRICTNSNGFKISCLSKRNQDKEFDIAIIGDSFTEGVGLAFEKTFVGVIASNLSELKIANLGVSGYSPSIYFHKIKYLLDRGVKFKHVIVFVDMSDVHNEAVHYEVVKGRVKDRELVERSIFRTKPFDVDSRLWIKQRLSRFFPLTYNAARKLKMLATKGEKTFNYHPVPGVSWVHDQSATAYGEVGLPRAISLSVGYMEALYGELRRLGISLSIVVYPWPDNLVFDIEDSPHVRLWSDFCKGKCVHFINLFPLFWDRVRLEGLENSIMNYYFAGDVHFNAMGNQIIGEEIVRVLKNKSN